MTIAVEDEVFACEASLNAIIARRDREIGNSGGSSQLTSTLAAKPLLKRIACLNLRPIGRSTEIEWMTHHCRSGVSTTIVSGPYGIGKTTVLREAAASLTAEGYRVGFVESLDEFQNKPLQATYLGYLRLVLLELLALADEELILSSDCNRLTDLERQRLIQILFCDAYCARDESEAAISSDIELVRNFAKPLAHFTAVVLAFDGLFPPESPIADLQKRLITVLVEECDIKVLGATCDAITARVELNSARILELQPISDQTFDKIIQRFFDTEILPCHSLFQLASGNPGVGLDIALRFKEALTSADGSEKTVETQSSCVGALLSSLGGLRALAVVLSNFDDQFSANDAAELLCMEADQLYPQLQALCQAGWLASVGPDRYENAVPYFAREARAMIPTNHRTAFLSRAGEITQHAVGAAKPVLKLSLDKLAANNPLSARSYQAAISKLLSLAHEKGLSSRSVVRGLEGVCHELESAGEPASDHFALALVVHAEAAVERRPVGSVASLN